MTHAITHFLIPAILVNLFRDYFVKYRGKNAKKKHFPIYLVLIAGLAGLLPDFDVGVYWILHYAGFTLSEIHRTFTHNIFIPLVFLFLGLIMLGYKKGKASNILFVISFGVFMHLLLDMIIAGYIMPFYPIYNFSVGLNLVNFLPVHFQESFLPTLDAILLILWIVYLGVKHKIHSVI